MGLYYFGTDKNEQNYLLKRTSSGGVTVNNVIGHLQQTDLPFGGLVHQEREDMMPLRALRISQTKEHTTKIFLRDLMVFLQELGHHIKVILKNYLKA